jgi:hypothetical protein
MTPAALLASCCDRVNSKEAYLADHALGNLAWVQTVIETETTYVRVRADTLDAS